ncbi:unnamed protein product [Bursaphelenchus okinawaensis]|uniref:Large ribosomal subunit protein mL62 n=1 Tax=Bursaphelenchus okinawaensis TaxID=465554 RepID=A0A811KGY1_9BILA|nr:unnamed protein product [Bursaphelenchus okinawaensis]CAG9102967.1 unnamed protein product [Bursaphelenchus okinawaensis]
MVLIVNNISSVKQLLTVNPRYGFTVNRCFSDWRNGIFPKEKFRKTLMRSSGPGGQNVNKVNTKVEIRFDLNECDFLPSSICERLVKKYPNRYNKLGEFMITSDEMRTAEKNEQICYEKLQNMLLLTEKELKFENRVPTEQDNKVLQEKRERAAKIRRTAKETQKMKRKWRSMEFD